MRHHGYCVIALLLVAALATQPALATTYISAEPIPSAAVVGAANLAKIEQLHFTEMERWSQRLLHECRIVDQTIDVLAAYHAIDSVNATNTNVVVGSGGFEAITHPSYVLTVRDTGPGAVSADDINVLGNALGYVLNQDSTAFFTPDNANAYQFALEYVVVTFASGLSGERAKRFFDFVGTVDPALWSGPYAGYTQIDFAGSSTNNSMLFLRPEVTSQQFIDGLSAAASIDPDATYVTLDNNGTPTTAEAGVAFPENDWLTFPDGDQYLSQVTNLSSQLGNALAALRKQHLRAVSNLVRAIDLNQVAGPLDYQFLCQ